MIIIIKVLLLALAVSAPADEKKDLLAFLDALNGDPVAVKPPKLPN